MQRKETVLEGDRSTVAIYNVEQAGKRGPFTTSGAGRHGAERGCVVTPKILPRIVGD